MPIPRPTTLHHTSYVVRDLEATAHRLSRSLGIGPWNVWTIAPERCVLHGRETKFNFRIAMATVGDGIFELITPREGRSVYDEELEARGDGFHHACFVYGSAREVLDVIAELRSQGREILEEGSTPGVFEWAYVRFAELASAIEILWVDMSKLPPPDAIIG